MSSVFVWKKKIVMHFMQCNMIIKFQPVWTQWFSEDRGGGVEFKCGFILILAVHPIPFQRLLVLSSFAIFSRIKPGNMQTQQCTSKWFYVLTKTMHVLRKISLSCHYITLNAHSRTGRISGITRGRFEVLSHRKTKVNISFMYSFLLNSDQLRAWVS